MGLSFFQFHAIELMYWISKLISEPIVHIKIIKYAEDVYVGAQIDERSTKKIHIYN